MLALTGCVFPSKEGFGCTPRTPVNASKHKPRARDLMHPTEVQKPTRNSTPTHAIPPMSPGPCPRAERHIPSRGIPVQNILAFHLAVEGRAGVSVQAAAEQPPVCRSLKSGFVFRFCASLCADSCLQAAASCRPPQDGNTGILAVVRGVLTPPTPEYLNPATSAMQDFNSKLAIETVFTPSSNPISKSRISNCPPLMVTQAESIGTSNSRCMWGLGPGLQLKKALHERVSKKLLLAREYCGTKRELTFVVNQKDSGLFQVSIPARLL